MIQHLHIIVISFFILFAVNTQAQVNDLAEIEQILGNWLEEQEDEGDAIEDFIDILIQLKQQPLPLNKANLGPLLEIRLISDQQLRSLTEHIEKYGALLAIEELQSLPYWDIETIQRIRHFVKVEKGLDDLSLSAKELLKQANYTIALYGSTFRPTSRGYTPKDIFSAPNYEGSPYRHYIRMRAQYGYNISVGVTAEKDAGEAFFKGTNSNYDYKSFHLYAKGINKWLNQIALGDYKISMGQGLIQHNGFGGGKSAVITNIKRNAKFIRPHASTSEFEIFRGGALELTPAKNIVLDVFYSQNNRDGNIVLLDTITNDETDGFSSFQTSGLHRTEGEIEDERSIQYRAIGGRVRWETKDMDISINALQSHLDKPLQRRIQPYNQFLFNGTDLTNVSLSYSKQFAAWHLFGESAYSDNGAMAHVVGIKGSLTKYIQFVSHYRHYPRDYQVLSPNAFGESRGANNERGFYAGIDWRLTKNHGLFMYADFWKHPWLRFGIDAPSQGVEYLIKYRYYEKRRIEAYALYKLEMKDQGVSAQADFRSIAVRRRDQLRLHFSYKLHSSLEWRSRIEFNRIAFQNEVDNGYLLYQDFIYKPIESPISLTIRYMYFDNDSGDSRIYTYENNLLYNFTLSSFSGTGHRYYLNVRYRPLSFLTLEGRIAQVRFIDAVAIGTSTNEIVIGNKRTEIAAQIRFTF